MRRIRLVPDDTRLPFFRYRWIAFAWSFFVLGATVLMVATVGLNYGIDFRGGILLEVRTPGPADLGRMRSTLGELDLGEVALQEAGAPDEVLIRVESQEGGEAAQRNAIETIKHALDGAMGGGLTWQRAEFVGPKVSSELLMNGVYAVLLSLAGVFAYLWFRFEWQYSVGAIAALAHDVSATIGIYAITGFEFNLTSLAVVLTIMGYSLNDTVVIFDRVRENLRRYKAMPIEQLLDRSLNETLARTLMTALTTILALAPLWLIGGDVIREFALVMLWGVVIGTYSTVYIATPVLYYLNLRAAKAQDAGPARGKGGSAAAGGGSSGGGAAAKKPAAAAPSAPALPQG
jgi:preprotein translocase subunit SecF